MMKSLLTLCTLVVFLSLNAENAYLSLEGHLSKERLTAFQNEVQNFSSKPPQELGISVHSSSGDLLAMLDLAKALSTLKTEHRTKISVYIDDQAIGPAAILPFLADSMEGSLFIAWGDIPASAENVLPTNLLQNQVLSLIDPKAKNLQILQLLARAMCDKQLQIIDDHGWKIANADTDGKVTKVSVIGQTLVVNQNQLKELGLLTQTTTLSEFESRFGKKETPQVIEIPLKKIDESLKAHIKYNPSGPNTVGKIAIDDQTSGINQSTWIYVKNALDYYKKHPPAFLILELNTPGGEVFAAEKISDALKELDTQYNIPVVAYINKWAFSAGALLAYSCRYIAVVKDASMGAAEVVQADSSGDMKTASEKVNSAFRADFANRAQFFDRNPLIAEAMVDKDVILVFRHGNFVKLDNESQIRTVGPDPDVVVSPKGKLLTLTAEQLMAYGVADIELKPAKLEPITAEEKEKGVWPATKELLFTYPFFAEMHETTVDQYRMDWKTMLFVFLANPIVTSALMFIMMMGFYIEFNTPGSVLPGVVAVCCLGLLALSSFSLEIGDWLELIFVLAGLGIILFDLLILPTFGLLGIIGVLLFLIGFLGMLLPGLDSVQFEYGTHTFNAAGEALMNRLAWVLGTLLAGLVAIALLARYIMPSFSGFKRFVLEGNEQLSKNGYTTAMDPKILPAIHAEGVALTSLRPAGKVDVAGRQFDAMSTGRFIEKGAAVIVVRYEGSNMLVTEKHT